MSDTYVSIDLEMTSGRPESQEVVEIAAIKFRGDRVLGTWSRLVKPNTPLPYSVQVLTGIRREDLARAPALPEVSGQLLAFVGDFPVVGHTVSADVGCLRRQGVVLSNPQLDTFELASVLLPRMPSYSLASLVGHLGIPFPNQHRAAADALVTKELFTALVRLAGELDLSVLQEINRLVAPFEWPLKAVFRKVEAERGRAATLGASIRQQLIAKADDYDLPLEVLLLAPPEEEPLRPAAERRPVDVGRLAEMLEPGGPLADARPGCEVDTAQAEALRAVADALDGGRSLLLEAGPGAGRALAYLLPAVDFAVANGQPVVVAASTPGLQDRLSDEHLPELRRHLPTPFRWARLRSRGSYLCLRRWTALRHRRDLSLTEALTLVKTLVWLPTTQTGDVAELNLTDAERAVSRRVSADDGYCVPETCQHARRGVCFLTRASRAAASAHVVVTSHDALLSDLSAANRMLPAYRHLIVDEAHRLEDEATEQLGDEVRAGAVLAHLEAVGGQSGLAAELPERALGSALRPAEREALGEAAQALARAASLARPAAQEFLDALASFLRDAGRDNRGNEQRARVTRGLRARPTWGRVRQTWEALDARLGETQVCLARLETLFAGLTDRRVKDYEDLLAQLRYLRAFEERLRDEVAGVVADADPDRVCWISRDAAGDMALHAAPVHVGDALARDLFEPLEALVLTSDTLAVEGRFDYVKGRLGLRDTVEATVASALDCARSVLLYLPTDVPAPEQSAYQQHFQQALVDLCSATQGRALVLFTSHGQLRQTWKAIHEKLADRGILVLGQGIEGASRRHLLQTFRTNARTVLLGTGSYWDSVEIPGDALSVLVIARLPFAPPGDPVIAARSEGLREPLVEYSLPQTILRFRRGFGRLTLSRRDRRVVVVFDRRLQSKSYGPAIVRSLPECTVVAKPTRELPGEAARWLGAE